MPSANSFNLDKTKLLSSGKGLKDNILVVSNSDLSSANTLKPNQPKVVSYHAIELKNNLLFHLVNHTDSFIDRYLNLFRIQPCP